MGTHMPTKEVFPREAFIRRGRPLDPFDRRMYPQVSFYDENTLHELRALVISSVTVEEMMVAFVWVPALLKFDCFLIRFNNG